LEPTYQTTINGRFWFQNFGWHRLGMGYDKLVNFNVLGLAGRSVLK
jgi:hypothetical protein